MKEFSTIGDNVFLGEETIVEQFCDLAGPMDAGFRNKFGNHFRTDRGEDGERNQGFIQIGNNNMLREYSNSLNT